MSWLKAITGGVIGAEALNLIKAYVEQQGGLEGGVGKQAESVACHGADGNSAAPANPKLAGQIEAYTHKQLVDFTTPNRQQPVMTTYAKMLTEDEKRNIAAYLATLRSVVVSPSQSVTCTVVAGEEAVISVDGWIDEPLAIGDRVTISAAKSPIRFAELNGVAPFWDLVRQKVDLLPR